MRMSMCMFIYARLSVLHIHINARLYTPPSHEHQCSTCIHTYIQMFIHPVITRTSMFCTCTHFHTRPQFIHSAITININVVYMYTHIHVFIHPVTTRTPMFYTYYIHTYAYIYTHAHNANMIITSDWQVCTASKLNDHTHTHIHPN